MTFKGPIKLYHYWRSSCSWRVRWILAYKSIPAEMIDVNLLNEESLSPEHLKRNPMGYVPVLEVPTDKQTHLLIESTAIAEWVEEVKPSPPLLPRDAYDRAQVRTLVELVNSGIQPIGNLTVLEHLSSENEVRKAWSQHWIRRGFDAYEKLVQKTAGEFAFGNSLTLADIYLVPQCYNALRNDISLDDYPTIARVHARALQTESGQASHPDRFKPAT
jgi:maleylacetoacetate isomerase